MTLSPSRLQRPYQNIGQGEYDITMPPTAEFDALGWQHSSAEIPVNMRYIRQAGLGLLYAAAVRTNMSDTEPAEKIRETLGVIEQPNLAELGDDIYHVLLRQPNGLKFDGDYAEITGYLNAGNAVLETLVNLGVALLTQPHRRQFQPFHQGTNHEVISFDGRGTKVSLVSDVATGIVKSISIAQKNKNSEELATVSVFGNTPSETQPTDTTIRFSNVRLTDGLLPITDRTTHGNFVGKLSLLSEQLL